MLDIIVATKNVGKLREIRAIMPNVNFKSLADIGFTDEIVENGKSFKENAFIKASYIGKKYNSIVLADDSGLSVRALNYAPGIYSARFSQDHNDKANNAYLVKCLKGIEDRYAFFTCSMCLYFPNREPIFVEEICEGKIVDEARGSNGFGYDPHFYIEKLGKCMAELSSEEKNAISHRGKALRSLKKVIEEL